MITYNLWKCKSCDYGIWKKESKEPDYCSKCPYCKILLEKEKK